MNRLLLLAPRIATNRLWARAGEVPSFHIAPARTGNARDLITGSVLGTYNSASPAWTVGPDGVLFQPAANAPVIEYDPTTLACRGARIWDVVLNLSLHSRDLTQTAWSKSGITPTRDQVGANGVSNTATRLTATSSDGTCLQTITSASATRVSGFYIRRITGTGTVEITQNGGATWTAVTLTSAFVRYSIASATITNPQIGFRIRSNGDEIAVDFAQLQSSAILGPPVATAGVTASSTADVWTITGADFSRIWNQSEVTMYADVAIASAASASNQFIARASDNTYNNQISLGLTSDGYPQFATASGGTFDGVAGSSTIITANAAFKLAAASQLNDLALSHSNSIFTDSSANTPTSLTRFDIGSDHLGFNRVVGMYLRELAIFRSRRPNANLQAMTS